MIDTPGGTVRNFWNRRISSQIWKKYDIIIAELLPLFVCFIAFCVPFVFLCITIFWEYRHDNLRIFSVSQLQPWECFQAFTKSVCFFFCSMPWSVCCKRFRYTEKRRCIQFCKNWINLNLPFYHQSICESDIYDKKTHLNSRNEIG